MSSFKSKVALLKATLSQQQSNEEKNHCHQTIVLKQCKGNKQELSLQQPIIIQKKTVIKDDQSLKRSKMNMSGYQSQANMHVQTNRKKVQPWIPVNIPPRQKKIDLESMTVPSNQGNSNKQIQIQIEKDDKNKDCLKKLFKKIKKLQDDLKESQKQRVRLNLELENYKGRSRICAEHDKIINQLEKDKYRLEVDVELLRKLLKERDDENLKLNSRVPKELIKEVIVQKPVQVIVQVPKHVPGPQRIVQKIVEVPKYVQVEKKVPYEVIKEVEKEVIRTVEVPTPTIVQKPVYIDKPIYIDRPVQVEKIVEVPIEIPVEYPVYIDKPVVEEEFLIKMKTLEAELQVILREKAILGDENYQLKIKTTQLSQALEVMKRHNEQKNREVQHMFQASIDYGPYSPSYYHHPDISQGSVKYSISSNPHPRII